MKKISAFACGLMLWALLLLGGSSVTDAASIDPQTTKYPVTITNGNRTISFDTPPKRVVTNGDSNIIELMFTLGLENKLIGYAGFPEYGSQVSPQYQKKLDAIPLLSAGYIELEPLLKANPDFFLSGFEYGLSVPGDTSGNAITPEELTRHGIKCYAITESLIRVMKKPPVSLEDTYTDIKNLGIIFNVQKRAQKAIQQMRNRVAAVEKKLSKVNKPLRVYIYPIWTATDEAPPAAASQAMPSALVSLLKAKNIFADIDDSWVKVSWEEIVARDPDVILILEYGKISGKERKKFILQNPALQSIKAVRNGKIHVIRIENVYPGPRAVRGLEMIAEALYPELF